MYSVYTTTHDQYTRSWTYSSAADESEEEAAAAQSNHEQGGARATTQRLGEDVEESGVDGADDGELRAHAKSDEHHEKHNGPQRRHRKSRNHFRVDDESQTGTFGETGNVR